MYKFLSRSFSIMFLTAMVSFARAQDSLKKAKPEMAGLMRSNGKIYVVVTVLLIILSGLFIYLVNLDRRLGRLEKIDKK